MEASSSSILGKGGALDLGVVGSKTVGTRAGKVGGQLIVMSSLKRREEKMMKKKLKLVKVVSRDLSTLSTWGFGDGLIDDDKGKKISEAAELLLEQLNQLREEEKGMKKKRKEAKARMKVADAGIAVESICSDYSEGDLEMVNILEGLTVDEPQLTIPVEAIPIHSTSLSTQEQKKLERGGAVEIGRETMERRNRIEVCMGGKCKKSGAMALMEEFERRVGGEVGVVGCKCMGKCRDGPNVRVFNMNGCDAPNKSPLCIGVGLEDVGLIVGGCFGGMERKDLGLMAS